jgi:hypothetical protein
MYVRITCFKNICQFNRMSIIEFGLGKMSSSLPPVVELVVARWEVFFGGWGEGERFQPSRIISWEGVIFYYDTFCKVS